MHGQVLLLRRALQVTIGPIRIKVPKSKAYNGVRSVKELDNFLWDTKNYNNVEKVQDAKKVSLTTMYLNDDAKVLWRTRVAEVEVSNLPKIEIWEILTREMERIKSQHFQNKVVTDSDRGIGGAQAWRICGWIWVDFV